MRHALGRRSRLVDVARGKFGFLLVALISLLMSTPMMSEGGLLRSLIILFVAGVLVAGLYAVRPGRSSLHFGMIVAAVEFAIGRAAIVYPARWLILAQMILWIVALLYVTVAILEWVLDSPQVSIETLQAAFCVYLLLGLLWVYLYALTDLTTPDSFRVLNVPPCDWLDERSRRTEYMRLFVFSYATLTGTGLGGIEPGNGFSNILASLEAMSAQVYLAVVVARPVGMQASTPPSTGQEDHPRPPELEDPDP